MPVDVIDQKKKNQVEVLKIIKRTRAKGVDDELARIYEPGEEIRISGSGKLSILALKYATRNLNADIESPVKRTSNKSVKEKEESLIPGKAIPKLSDMKLNELDEYADISLGLDIKKFRTKPEKIAAIKSAIEHAGN